MLKSQGSIEFYKTTFQVTDKNLHSIKESDCGDPTKKVLVNPP